jgi:hypothetical protein
MNPMQNSNKKTIVFAAVFVVFLVGLIVWQKYNNGSGEQGAHVASTVPFVLPNAPLVQHIHPELTIVVDGEKETIPANIGLGAQHRVLHTHDTDGVIHVEAQDTRAYTLGDFFSVWGKTIERDGYSVELAVDGAPSEDFDNLVLKDKQQIVLTYTKK